jgi:Icc protein
MQLVWATDIHLNFVGRREVEAFCQSIVDSRADAVLLGGDIATSKHVVDYLALLAERARRPIYFVLGNHDYYHGSIAAVRDRVRALTTESRWLRWLDEMDVVPLTPTTGLVGHSGWGDARLGDYEHSPVIMTDFIEIAELRGLDRETRRATLATLGDEAATHFRQVLPAAVERFPHVLVLTHVPPFQEACWHDGHISGPDFLPHFTCRAVGAVLLEIMRARPDRQLTVLCGHSHGAGEARPLRNVYVRTGAAFYGMPALQPLIGVDEAGPDIGRGNWHVYQDFHAIRPGLFLGSRPRQPGDLIGLFGAVLDLRDDLGGVAEARAVYAAHGIGFFHLPLSDGVLPGGGIAELDAALDWLAARLADGSRVLVHCDAGRSRSAFVVAYHLIRTEGLTADAAVDDVRAHRPVVDVYAGYLTLLRQAAGMLSAAQSWNVFAQVTGEETDGTA